MSLAAFNLCLHIYIAMQACSLILKWKGSVLSEQTCGPRANVQWLGCLGAYPLGNFGNFRRSEIDSVAFWATFLSW